MGHAHIPFTVTYIYVAFHLLFRDAPEMFSKATRVDFQHTNEGCQIDCP